MPDLHQHKQSQCSRHFFFCEEMQPFEVLIGSQIFFCFFAYLVPNPSRGHQGHQPPDDDEEEEEDNEVEDNNNNSNMTTMMTKVSQLQDQIETRGFRDDIKDIKDIYHMMMTTRRMTTRWRTTTRTTTMTRVSQLQKQIETWGFRENYNPSSRILKTSRASTL